jgi:alpha-galactosidase
MTQFATLLSYSEGIYQVHIPMRTYSSEIWRYENIDALEKKHIKHIVSYCLILNLQRNI